MPKIGEIKKGRDVGYKSTHNFIWASCLDCGKERWVMLLKGKPQSLRCKSCSSKLKPRIQGCNHSHWKGGRYRVTRGYITVYVSPDDFFAPMRNKTGHVLEHRLVVAKALGRCLQPWEIVHHKNRIKDDNRYPQNLELTMGLNHQAQHMAEERFKALEADVVQLRQRILLLEAENVLLRSKSWENPKTIYG